MHCALRGVWSTWYGRLKRWQTVEFKTDYYHHQQHLNNSKRKISDTDTAQTAAHFLWVQNGRVAATSSHNNLEFESISLSIAQFLIVLNFIQLKQKIIIILHLNCPWKTNWFNKLSSNLKMIMPKMIDCFKDAPWFRYFRVCSNGHWTCNYTSERCDFHGKQCYLTIKLDACARNESFRGV